MMEPIILYHDIANGIEMALGEVDDEITKIQSDVICPESLQGKLMKNTVVGEVVSGSGQ